MTIMSTAEMRRIEAEQNHPDKESWSERIERFWARLADAFSPRVAKPYYYDDSERIMSIGDD